MRFFPFAIALSFFVTTTGVAQESSVAINFYDAAADSPAVLNADDVAGQAAVLQANWNNLAVSHTDGQGHWNRGDTADLVDQSGNKVHNMQVIVQATDSTQVFPVSGAGWGFTGGDLILQSAHVHPQPQIVITGIPYTSYDVYAYVGAGVNKGGGKATISVADGADGEVDPARTYWYRVKWENGKYVKATSTSNSDVASSNYIHWTGNTASDIVIDWDGKVGGGAWTGLKGIQIVDTSGSN